MYKKPYLVSWSYGETNNRGSEFVDTIKEANEIVKNDSENNYHVLIKDEGDVIAIYLNDEKHITLVKNGFHDAKLHTEQFNYAHGYFFNVVREIKVDGVDLMKHHLQIK